MHLIVELGCKVFNLLSFVDSFVAMSCFSSTEVSNLLWTLGITIVLRGLLSLPFYEPKIVAFPYVLWAKKILLTSYFGPGESLPCYLKCSPRSLWDR